MSRQPSYPKDAPVAPPPAAESATAAAATGKNDGAETPTKAERTGDHRRRNQIIKGAAIGIGSAAIVAALLYANRSRRSDRS